MSFFRIFPLRFFVNSNENRIDKLFQVTEEVERVEIICMKEEMGQEKLEEEYPVQLYEEEGSQDGAKYPSNIWQSIQDSEVSNMIDVLCIIPEEN